ncbi:5'-AMP-activated serine/threonine-protein kinase catalytic subunit alpha-like [Ruditapes philippinarum]|uniref:5'-AMP-activated serine/threonine-protein kinase catalytic subunit alpha-like n=1 Tax=Ruditapes philippinarum TaxID=129788 RepID=UPI00295C36EF|nr:5'-AMP-activated serine/threonine-protein kinase catalytic subunit alpha-like [Ruditapes philippinarum]
MNRQAIPDTSTSNKRNNCVLKSPVNSNVQYSDISSDELPQNDNLDFGDEPDVSFSGQTSEVDQNNNDVNGVKNANTDGVEVISDVEDVVVNNHRDDDANVNGVNTESENEYDANQDGGNSENHYDNDAEDDVNESDDSSVTDNVNVKNDVNDSANDS